MSDYLSMFEREFEQFLFQQIIGRFPYRAPDAGCFWC